MLLHQGDMLLHQGAMLLLVISNWFKHRVRHHDGEKWRVRVNPSVVT